MRSTVLSILLASCIALPAAGQGVTWGYSAGLTAETGDRLGFTTAASATFQTSWDLLDVQVEGIYQQAQARDLFAIGSLVLEPWAGQAAPYLIAGSGVYLDNGANLAWNAGVGFEFGEVRSAPLFLEYRLLFGRDQSSGLSMGIRF